MIDEIRSAWKLASKYHFDQKYGGEEANEYVEYLEHIGSVFMETQNAINIENVRGEKVRVSLLCSILHDIIEDTDCREEEIMIKFGEEVLNGVLALTKDENLKNKEEMMKDSLERINKVGSHIAIVKLCDRICNLYAPPFYWNKEKMVAYVKEAQLINENLGYASKFLSNRLEDKIKEYKLKFIL